MPRVVRTQTHDPAEEIYRILYVERANESDKPCDFARTFLRLLNSVVETLDISLNVSVWLNGTESENSRSDHDTSRWH